MKRALQGHWLYFDTEAQAEAKGATGVHWDHGNGMWSGWVEA